MKKALHILIGIAVVVVSLDMLGFCLWVVTGQTPPSGFYIGFLTTHAVVWIQSLIS